MGTSIPGQGSLQAGSFAQKIGQKEQNYGLGGGAVEWGGMNIGMKTWH